MGLKGVSFFRFATLGVVTVILVGCNEQFGFVQNPLHSSLKVPDGIKITSPDPMTVDKVGIRVEGTCQKDNVVEIKGAGTGKLSDSKLDCKDGTFSTYIEFSNGDGAKNIVAFQSIVATGKWAQDERDFLKDSTPPKVLITSPTENAETMATVVVSGQCETGLSVDLSLASGRVGQVICTNGSFSTSIDLPSPDGIKNIVAQQIDAAGNQGTDSKNYLRDSVAPVIKIGSPAINSLFQRTARISGTCESGLLVAINGAVSTAQNTLCADGKFEMDVTFSDGDGIKNIVASQTDKAGNQGRDDRNLLKDATAPALKITSPVANTVTKSNVQVAGSCESGISVLLSGDAVGATAVTTGCNNGLFSYNLNLTGADGKKTLIATQTDLALNKSQDQQSVELDTTAPKVTITSPAANSNAVSGITLNGTCETGLDVNVSGGVSSTVKGACNNGAYSISVQFSSGDGKKTINVSQTDRVGNTASISRDFNRDSTAPVLAITSPAPNFEAVNGVRLQGNCETGVNVEISGAGVDKVYSTACTAGKFDQNINFSAGEGNKVVNAKQTDDAGNTTSDQRIFIKDSIAPVVAISSPNINAFVTAQITLTGKCETGLSVAISGTGITASTSTPCAAGNFSQLITLSAGEGKKDITVEQIDKAGNQSSDSRSFFKDTISPAIVITSPAANSLTRESVNLQGNCETGLDIDLSGAGLQSPQKGFCDNGKFAINVLFTTGDGAKDITVGQTDKAGNMGKDSRSFLRDQTAPVLEITRPAPNTIAKTGLTINGNCENGLSVLVNGAGVANQTNVACQNQIFAANITFTNGDGVKNVVVSQTDAAGNTGSDNKNFYADNTAPKVSITSPIEGSYVMATADIKGECESNLKVNLSGVGITQMVIADCLNGTYTGKVTFTAGDGSKVVTASQTDAIGNTATTQKTYLTDGTSPNITIDTPAANTVAKNSIAIGGVCEDGLTISLSGTGLDGQGTTTCTNSRYSVTVPFTAGDGVKNIVATQTDLAGNTTAANRNFISDNTTPIVAITSPANNDYMRASFTVAGTCETGLAVNLSGSITSVNTTCTNGQFSATVAASTGDGVKSVTVKQIDAAGNVGSDSKQYNIDTGTPVVKITSPAAGTVSQTGFDLRGTCETGIEVVVYGPGIEGTTRTPCSGGNFVTNISLSLGEGNKQVNVAQTDLAGNMGTDSRTFSKDVTAPLIAFSTPDELTSFKIIGVNVAGSCETGLMVHILGSGITEPLDANCVAGKFTGAVSLTNGDGDKNIIAYQTDAAGNTGSAIRNVVLDTTAPAIAITSPAANTVFKDKLTLKGTCESGLDVKISGDTSNLPTQSCVSGQFSIEVLLTASDGTKNLVVSQTDKSGNLGSTNRNFIRDNSTPAIKITSPAANTNDQVGVTLQGTCTSGLAIALSGQGLGSPSSTTCTNGQFSQAIVFSNGDGLKTITVTQTGSNGNTAADSRDFIKGVLSGYEVFNVSLSNPKVDILFVDDNSSSMEIDQQKLGARFGNFITELNGVDWQIGITTTDCSTGPFGICGSLLALRGATGKILTSATANYQQVFANTIYREETVGCVDRGDCPTSNEQAVFASMTAMSKHSSDNAGFFRSDADLAIVVLGDEDERSGGAGATTAAQGQGHFKTIWPTGKKLSVYGIIIEPNDTNCLNEQKQQNGGIASFGKQIFDWSVLSGGVTGSICANDYSASLQSIGKQVRTVSDSVELATTPITSSVQVVFTPAQSITWTVQGSRILFSSAPPVGTKIEVWYDHQ